MTVTPEVLAAAHAALQDGEILLLLHPLTPPTDNGDTIRYHGFRRHNDPLTVDQLAGAYNHLRHGVELNGNTYNPAEVSLAVGRVRPNPRP